MLARSSVEPKKKGLANAFWRRFVVSDRHEWLGALVVAQPPSRRGLGARCRGARGGTGLYSSQLSSWRTLLGALGASGLTAKEAGRKPKLTEAERLNVQSLSAALNSRRGRLARQSGRFGTIDDPFSALNFLGNCLRHVGTRESSYSTVTDLARLRG
jgi:hypothetical protein